MTLLQKWLNTSADDGPPTKRVKQLVLKDEPTTSAVSKAKPVVVDLVEDGEEKQDVIVLLEKDDKNNVEQPVNEEEEDLDLDGVQFDFIEDFDLLVPEKEADFGSLQISEQQNGAYDDGEDADYEVEKVLGSEGSGKDERFLVKWKNWAWKTNTMEPRKNLYDCSDMIREFRRRQDLREAIAKLHLKNLGKHHHYPNVHKAPSFRKVTEWEWELNEKLQAAGHAPIYIENWTDDDAGKPEDFEVCQ
ncbi:suppressor of variegation 3-9 [Aphelenchoides avenae]|nr:suppressor of variegation 3-9 [Aphelenchus avenae]